MPGYDPDVLQAKIDNVDAREFGIRLARAIQKEPSSNNQVLVGNAMIALDDFGFGLEWEQIQSLVDRIAGEPLDESR